MLIECPVQRPGGSHVELWSTEYHFQEQPDGAHVAEVADPKHQDRFLAIGYRIYRGAAKPAAQKPASKLAIVPPPPAEIPLKGSIVHPAEFDIAGKKVSIAAVIEGAFARSGLTREEWNAMENEARHDLLDAELDFMAGDVDTDGDGQSEGSEERAKLVGEYQEKFGKKPHHKWSAEKIREELAK